jgi:uncharacterized repeat protein (TIGR01451 family)
VAQPPVAVDDLVSGLPTGTPAVLDPLGNDSDPDGALDPATVVFVSPPAGSTLSPDGKTLTVPGEGVWTIDPVTGEMTFTPEAGFTADPTPVSYTVADNDGNVSSPATVTLAFDLQPSISLLTEVAEIVDTNGNGITDLGDVITYRFEVTNTGNAVLNNVDITATSLPMPGLSCTPVTLVPGETVTLVCSGATHTITPADVAEGEVVLTATVSGTDQSATVVSSSSTAVAVPLLQGGLNIDKQAGVGSVRVGQIIPYTITVTNTSTILPVVVDVQDTMPGGLIYQPGSGTVGGAATEPVLEGQRLTFAGVTVPASGSVTITLSALVSGGAQPGTLSNQAVGLHPGTGAPLSPIATATVLLNADPVFDCGTVIGRVWDDQNQDGYMNGQERGLAAVRLVTVRGTIITTDKFGRFNVPCPDLPRDIGSNFLLKLDERTLPSGYRLTTENPRVVRLTAGKMVEMNFGAALSKIVRVDLSGTAFLGGDDPLQPREELVEGLKQLVAQIATKPSVLRLNYVLAGEKENLAKRRLKEVERLIRKLWRDTGKYELRIEPMLQRPSDKE